MQFHIAIWIIWRQLHFTVEQPRPPCDGYDTRHVAKRLHSHPQRLSPLGSFAPTGFQNLTFGQHSSSNQENNSTPAIGNRSTNLQAILWHCHVPTSQLSLSPPPTSCSQWLPALESTPPSIRMPIKFPGCRSVMAEIHVAISCRPKVFTY